MRKTGTMRDLTCGAGVHVSTVSRALSPPSRASTSLEVVRKIQKLAEMMGYRPNRVASGLRTKRTTSVGIMIPDIENTLFSPILKAVESVLEPTGYASFLVNTDDNTERGRTLFNLLIDRVVDCIIAAAVTRVDRISENIPRELAIVTVNRMIEEFRISAITNDDSEEIQINFRKIYDIGHRRIAHISGPINLSTGVQRRAAFETASQSMCLRIPQLMIVDAQRYSEEEGQRCAAEVLANNPDITALLCANDRLAIGAIEAITKMSLSCPDDKSVTGFNDVPFLELMTPALTTVRTLQFEVGRIPSRNAAEKDD